MIDTLVQSVIAGAVWIVANAVYLDMKRKGKGGFTRFAAFWAGLPTTLVTFVVVPEGHRPAFEAPRPDDDVALLEAIRRDRRSRGDVDHPDPTHDPTDTDAPAAGRGETAP